MVDNFRLTVDSNTEIEPLETVRDVRMKGQSLVDNRVATIPQMTGATSSSNGSAGVVPTPSVGDREKFLRGDGTWAEASGGGGSNVSVDQILDDGVNIMDITIDNVTTHIYAPENDPNAVVDVEVNGVSVVTNNVAEITITESVTDVVDANGNSLVDANGVAHVTGEVVDVVNGDGDSLVDENGVAHVTGDITDVEYDGTSVVNENGVAELFSDRKITTLPLLDYDNVTAIQGSSQWADSTPHDWVAPCDCVIIARNNRGNNGDTFVRYVIDGFIYYTTSNSDRSDSIPYGLYSDMIPVRKGHTVTIQLQGTIDTQRLQNRFYYIPYKEVNKSAIDFPLPYLDHEHRISIDYSTTSYTANTDGLLICVTNGTKTLVVNSSTTATFYGRPNSSNYFDCSLPISSGDTVSGLSTGTKYFIPFKRTDNINKLVSPVPDYGNAVAYTGATLPERFSDYGFVFLTSQGMSQWTNTDNLSYSIGDTGNTAYLNISSTTINNVVYRKESFLPVDPTFVKFYGATAGETVYFVPYAEFESAYVKDVQIQGRSIVESGGIANIESLVTDVQYQGKSLVGEGGIAEVTGKVADVQLEGISILDENAVANLKGNMGIFTSPILDYDKIGFIEESKTWTDRTPHDWTAPCDCVIFSCSPNANGGYTFLVDGEFTYKVYKNVWGSYNNNVYASYYTMLPVAKGSVVTLTPTGQKDTSSSYKIAYIPYKKATTLQSVYTLPYLDYENKTAIEWASPIIANELICEYTAPVDGYVSIDLFIGGSNTPTVTYTVNDNNNVNIMTRAMEANYYPNGIILGKGDTISIYDAGNVPTYTYTGNIYFTPFATTPSLREVVSPIPDYANLETLDLTDFPTTFDTGYIFNCAERQGDNLLKYCKITLSDSVKIYTKSDPYNVTHEYSYFPISGDETLVSVEYETNAGNVYYIPYSEVEVTPVLVSDVQVNGASVVDANGVAHITGGGGGSTVTVTPIQTTGTKIAEIDVDGVTSDLYAPNGGGGGSTVSVTQKVSSGENIASITVDGVATELYATNTTYSDFDGATSQAAGAHGLVPAPTTSDTAKFLKGDGTWATPDSGSDVSVTQVQSTGTKIATITVDNVDTDLYAPNGGSGGASELDDLDDVEITSPTNGQVLKYNSVTQKWENKGSSGTKINIYDQFDSLLISDRYATASLSNGFSFSMSEEDGTWSTSATAYTNTAIDLTDYDSLELEITISSQTNYGAFWVTLSNIKYTWSGSQWAQIYFKPSAIKITESGTYTVDVSELSGEYYIYMGGTTGKDTVAAGDCDNTLNGGIAGNVDSVSLIVSGSSEGVVPNPEGEPTDTLNTIEIDGVIYDFAGGGGEKDYVKKKYIYTLTVAAAWQYFTDPQSDNPLLIEAVGGGAIRSYRVDADSLPTYESYTTIGTDIMGHAINMCKSSNGDIGISVNDSSISGETIKVYEVIGYSIEADNIVKIYDSGSDTTPATQNTDITYIDGIDISNYDLIIAAYSSDRGSVSFPQTIYATGIIDEILNDTDNDWVVAGYGERWAMLDIGATSFRVTAGSYGIYKLFVVKLGGSGNANIEELTQGEYNVLPSSQKENGTMYLVHDGDEEVDLTVRMTGYTSTSGTASAVGSLNANFLAWHAFASENTFNANVNGEYWAGDGEGAYLQFDFANAVSITKVAYASYQYSSFDLMYSTDGTTYNLAETLTQADQGTTAPTKQDYVLSNQLENVVSIRFVCDGASYNIGALHIYGNDGNITPNRIYLNGRKYAEVSDPEVKIEYYDYASFSGKGSIVLPFNLNADYKITVTFDIPVYSDDNAIIGNSVSNNYLHISQYASRYYTSTGTSETYFEDTLLGKHTYVINDDGTNKLDGVVKTSYTPTTDNNIALVVGGRDLSRPGLNLRGKIYEYIIESISTGEELMHLLPIKLKAAGVIIKSGLYDSVSGEVYTATGVTLGND